MSEEIANASSKLSVYCSSAEDFDHTCDLCVIDGDHVAAVRLCITCGEYMCNPCFKSHSKSKATRQHEFHDIDGVSQATRKLSNAADQGKRATIVSDDFDEDYKCTRELDITTEKDKENCFIVSMALLSGRKMAVVDRNNHSIKLIDIQNNEILADLLFDDEPEGITAVSDNELAATFSSENKIKVISTSGGSLTVTSSFKVFSNCWAITWYNGKLYVSFWNPLKFQILKLSGGVKKTITPKPNVDEHCIYPGSIAVHPDEESIYVSDFDKSSVIRIDMMGNLIALYMDESIKVPMNILCFSSGWIYVCDNLQHVLYKLPGDLSEAHVVLGKIDGLLSPRVMCYDSNKKILYINSDTKNCIQEYKQQ